MQERKIHPIREIRVQKHILRILRIPREAKIFLREKSKIRPIRVIRVQNIILRILREASNMGVDKDN